MASAPGSARTPAAGEVRAIAAIPDSVIRNSRITQTYFRLSLAMRARVGGGANWCTFAAWASRQAGCTIRGEDFLDRLTRYAGEHGSLLSPVRTLWRWLLRKGIFNPQTTLGGAVRAIHSPFDAFERASEAVAAGNLKVFEEIGFEFARYLSSCPKDAPLDSTEFVGFLAGLGAGPPPDGKDLLRAAFTHFQRQSFEPDPDKRHELQLLANLEIGLHEQTRLQPEIERAMDAGPDTAEDLFILYRPYRRFARGLTRRVISECLMELALPDVVLALGRHLDFPFPPVLQNVGLPELRSVLEKIEPPGVCAGCGVNDWADFNQRMHYIAHLFRAFHFHESLFRPPEADAPTSQYKTS